MRFKDLRNLEEIYDAFIVSGNKAIFSDIEQAESDFKHHILSMGLEANKAQDISDRVLLLCDVFEHQGFLNGLTKGINIHMDSEVMERK